MRFVGRSKQLNELNQRFNSGHAESIMIYGRRRVGKSTLINQALANNDVDYVYYVAKRTNLADNLVSISGAIRQALKMPVAFESFEDLFAFIYGYAKDRPFIFVIDEYPYLNKLTTGLDSVIQAAIDQYAKNSKLKLVLCGSSIEMMQQLIQYQNPLYGRFSLVMQLEPMHYFESALLYPGFSNDEKVALYAAFGGIPYFNQMIDEKLSVDQNIVRLIVSPNGPLFSEVPYYLQAEIGKIDNANAVLETIGKGYVKFSDILSQSHIESNPVLAQTLNRLIAIQIIRKVEPINSKGNRKKAQYLIADNFIAFYYRYVYPNIGRIQVMNPDDFYDAFIKSDFYSQYVPSVFEQVAGEYLIMMNQARQIHPPFYELGKYWYDDPINKQNGEFHLVSQDKNGYIFYECKFKEGKITDREILKEIQQVRNCGLNAYRFGFFSKSGFESKNIADVIYYSLDDLYQTDAYGSQSF